MFLSRCVLFFFFFKQKTAYEMRISDWSSDVCSSDLTSLLNSLEGRRGEVRAKPPLPAHEGLFGCPTLVSNVLTLAAVSHILGEGGAAQYAGLGMGRSRGTMPIQLGGNIRHGGLVEVPFGITLRELVHDIGGGPQTGRAENGRAAWRARMCQYVYISGDAVTLKKQIL